MVRPFIVFSMFVSFDIFNRVHIFPNVIYKLILFWFINVHLKISFAKNLLVFKYSQVTKNTYMMILKFKNCFIFYFNYNSPRIGQLVNMLLSPVIFYLFIFRSKNINIWPILFLPAVSPTTDERGKAGGHEPPLFPLPGHHIWLFRAKLPYWMVYLGPLGWDFQKSSRVTLKKHNSYHFFNST